MKKLILIAVMALMTGACTVHTIKLQEAERAQGDTTSGGPVFEYSRASFTYYFFWFNSKQESNMLCSPTAEGDLNCKK